MGEHQRNAIVERHDFYIDQIETRVLAQFNDIEGEADRYAEAAYEGMGHRPLWGNHDLADLADAAFESGLSHYVMLKDLRDQVLHAALAGLYHQWEKELRAFVERQLQDHVGHHKITEDAWTEPPRVCRRLQILRGWSHEQTKGKSTLPA